MNNQHVAWSCLAILKNRFEGKLIAVLTQIQGSGGLFMKEVRNMWLQRQDVGIAILVTWRQQCLLSITFS